MSPLLISIIAILVLALGANIAFVFFIIRKVQGTQSTDQQQSSSLLLQQMNEITRQLSDQSRVLHDSSRTQTTDIQRAIHTVNEQVGKHLLEVTRGVTEANQASRQIFTIADQLQNLEKVLKNQKQRGNLGEASLELILSNILPPTAYKLQYSFSDGETVDAIIETKEGFIPVDAKFSLDNYTRLINETGEQRKIELEKDFRNDLKKRIDETSKYIRTAEKTLPFAFMFIPAEGIYYDLLVNEIGSVKANTRNLLDYAYNDKKVIIVSPTTFAAYLQSVLYGFKAFKIEESAQEIRKHVEELQKHLKSYEEYHQKVGKSLSTVVSHFTQSNKAFKQIDKDVFKITGEKMGIEQISLEKPDFDE